MIKSQDTRRFGRTLISTVKVLTQVSPNVLLWMSQPTVITTFVALLKAQLALLAKSLSLSLLCRKLLPIVIVHAIMGTTRSLSFPSVKGYIDLLVDL